MFIVKRTFGLPICVAVLAGILLQGCSEDSIVPVATPSVMLYREKLVLGGPLDITYHFAVSEDVSQLTQDYWVFVHFLDSNGELMWTDDHQPSVPTSAWTAGQTVTYRRQRFVPVYPYIGEVSIAVGLYSPTTTERLPLSGEDLGQKSYKVASVQLLPQSASIFIIYQDGWYPLEYSLQDTDVEWRWTEEEAVFSFRNPEQDAVLVLHLAGRTDSLNRPTNVSIIIDDQSIETFELRSDGAMFRTVAMTGDELGSDPMVTLKLKVDRTFVPSVEIPGSSDDRELGVQVFNAFVEPL